MTAASLLHKLKKMMERPALRLSFALGDLLKTLVLLFWVDSLINTSTNHLYYSTIIWIGSLQFLPVVLLVFTSFVQNSLYQYNRILAIAKGFNLAGFIFWFRILIIYYGGFSRNNILEMSKYGVSILIFLFDLILFLLLLWGSKGPKELIDSTKDLPRWAQTSLEE